MSRIRELRDDVARRAASPIVVSGRTEIAGTVRIQGAKNTALKIIPALAGFAGVFVLTNVPVILDTLNLFEILVGLGASVDAEPAAGTFTVDTRAMVNRPIPNELTRQTTTAFYFAGALLGRFGAVDIGKPGGDAIGARPFDMHLAGFRDLGAEIIEDETTITATLAAIRPGARVKFRMPSAGATVNVLLAAAAGGVEVTIENVPTDADMLGFYAFLRQCGAGIGQHGNEVACHGRRNMPADPVIFGCPPDRNDTFTWLAAGAAASRRGLELTGVDHTDMRVGLAELAALGVRVTRTGASSLVVTRPERGLTIPPGHTVLAGPSPMFNSDWAPMLQLVLATASGTGRTVDLLHSNRIRQASLLRTMGADISIEGGAPPPGVRVHFQVPLVLARYIVTITGPAELRGVTGDIGNDVRACATAVLAATVADGTSELRGVSALARGYQDFVWRLRAVGADVAVT